MEIYINAIQDHVFNFWYNLPEYKYSNAINCYNQWTHEPDKHNVIDFFNTKANGAYYTQKQYESRLRCFYEVLKVAGNDDMAKYVMKNMGSVVSFGCGPGPEIAAYICYVRNRLHCSNLELDITAVDCLKYWRSYIYSIQNLDDYASIQFEEETLDYDYVYYMDPSDVCIMSYPHAMNFPNIWDDLKDKFSLVICIDQPKTPLLNQVTMAGYEVQNFLYKGPKTMFYYVNDNIDGCVDDDSGGYVDDYFDDDDDDDDDVDYYFDGNGYW